MKKRILSIIIAIILMFLMVSLVSASGIVIVNPISGVINPGSNLLIKGTTSLSEVTIRLISTDGTIMYYNEASKAQFETGITVKIPEDAPVGKNYIVSAGFGSIVDQTTFEVRELPKEPADPPEEPTYPPEEPADPPKGPTPPASTPKPSAAPVLNTEKGIIEVPKEAIAINNFGEASLELDKELLSAAFDAAKSDDRDIKTVHIDLGTETGCHFYEVGLPKEAVTSPDANKRIEIITDVGVINIQSNMFREDEIGDAASVYISIAAVDKADLEPDLADRIGDRPVIQLNVKSNGKIIDWSNPEAAVTVSIPYEPTDEELKNPNNIVIWYIDGQGRATPVRNCRYNAETGTVEFQTSHFSIYAVIYSPNRFIDMKNHGWAEEAVSALDARGVFANIESSAFNPGKVMTKAEFIYYLVNSLDLKANFDIGFDDIKPADFYYEAAGIAKELGIAKGIGNNCFDPDGILTRQDMMMFGANFLKGLGIIEESADIKYLGSFKDAADISDYAQENIARLVAKGFIKGSNERINPKAPATNAEAAVFLFRIYLSK